MTSLIRIEYDVIMITKKWYEIGVTDLIMSVMLILISIGEIYLMNVSHDTIVSNKHEEQTRYYYVNFQHSTSLFIMYILRVIMTSCSPQNTARSDSL